MKWFATVGGLFGYVLVLVARKKNFEHVRKLRELFVEHPFVTNLFAPNDLAVEGQDEVGRG